MLPFQEYLLQLWRESRGNVIGGVLAVIIIAVAGIFWKSLLKVIRRLFNRPAVQGPPPTSPVESPPVIRTTSRTPLPRPPIAGFVARRDQNGRDIVERLKEELSPEKEQLIVLWGAGGVGKTTLAAETARAMRNVFDGGIVWTSADGKPDFSLSILLDGIATHLGRPELQQLASVAKDNEVHDVLSKAPDTLIVLDNFDTISPNEQERCADWLADRASCSALITSRDEVRHARPVHILAMSEPEAKEFLQRLISDAHNQRAFEQLDHEQIIKAAAQIPLVLQWVVKRIDSAKQPLAVLDELSRGEGDAAERIFDRSFDLAQVGDDGRAVLLALSLFVPDASRPALANVAGFGNDENRLEQALQQLIELWLIQTTENNSRIRIEGLTRELTKARLGKDRSAQDYRQRFISYFREYTQKYAMPTPEDYEALEAEKDNLLNAMDTAFELEDRDTVWSFAYTIALPVDGMLSVRGYWAESLKANQQALESARQSNSRPELADFAYNLSVIHSNRGELNEARELCNESLKINRELANQQGIAYTLHQLALLTQDQDNSDGARRLHNESLSINRELGNQKGIASCLHELALLSHLEGNYADAHRLYRESLEIQRKLGNQRGIANVLQPLGMLARDQGKLVEARGLLDESLRMTRKLGDQLGMALTLNMLGQLAEDEKDLKGATRLFEEALSIFEKLQSPIADIVRQNLEGVRGK